MVLYDKQADLGIWLRRSVEAGAVVDTAGQGSSISGSGPERRLRFSVIYCAGPPIKLACLAFSGPPCPRSAAPLHTTLATLLVSNVVNVGPPVWPPKNPGVRMARPAASRHVQCAWPGLRPS